MPFDSRESDIQNVVHYFGGGPSHSKPASIHRSYPGTPAGPTRPLSRHSSFTNQARSRSGGTPRDATMHLDLDDLAEDEEMNILEPPEDPEVFWTHKYNVFFLPPTVCIIIIVPLLFFLPSFWSRPDNTSLPLTLSAALVLSASLWSLSFALRLPIFRLCTSTFAPYFGEGTVGVLASVTSTLLLVLLQEILRLMSFVIFDLQLHNEEEPLTITSLRWFRDTSADIAFLYTIFIGLGWAIAEVCTSTVQNFDQLYLYSPENLYPSHSLSAVSSRYPSTPNLLHTPRRGRLPPADDLERAPLLSDTDEVEAAPDPETGTMSSSQRNALGLVIQPTTPITPHRVHIQPQPDIQIINGSEEGRPPTSMVLRRKRTLDDDIARLSNIKARTELEEFYGLEFIDIPITIHLLQRIDSILLSIGLTLILGYAYIFSLPAASAISTSVYLPLPIAFLITTFTHLLPSLLHTSPLLSRIGMHSAAYISLLVALASLFIGLGLWGALS